MWKIGSEDNIITWHEFCKKHKNMMWERWHSLIGMLVWLCIQKKVHWIRQMRSLLMVTQQFTLRLQYLPISLFLGNLKKVSKLKNETLSLLSFRPIVPNLCGTRDQLRGRQFFHGTEREKLFHDDSSVLHLFYTFLYYYYISSTSDNLALDFGGWWPLI